MLEMAYSLYELIKATFRVIYDKGYEYINKPVITTPPPGSRIYPIVPLYEQFQTYYSEPTHIIDNVFLGSAVNAASRKTLEGSNIGAIVNATREISHYFENDYKYHRVPITDNNIDEIIPYLDESYEFMVKFTQENPDKNILVHCHMGASRSASVVINYLIKKHKMTYDEALNYTRTKRAIVNPTHKLRNDVMMSMILLEDGHDEIDCDRLNIPDKDSCNDKKSDGKQITPIIFASEEEIEMSSPHFVNGYIDEGSVAV